MHRRATTTSAPDAEKAGLAQLDRCARKPVAFAVRTNVVYANAADDDSPVHGRAVTFVPGDFLHIYEVGDGVAKQVAEVQQ